MEIKKYRHADLEHGRRRTFMISLIMVIAALFVALEYDFGAKADDGDEADEETEEFELAPLKKQEERIALALKQEPKPAADEIKVVEKSFEMNRMEMPDEKAEEEDSNDALKKNTKPKEEEDMLAPAANALDNNPLNFRVVEDLPQFPGGAMALMKWLTDNLKYPQKAQKKKIEGKVVVQFIVAADGTMTDLKVVQSLEASCDNEAMRVMRMMPKWKPGLQDGKPCRTMVAIPIVFKL